MAKKKINIAEDAINDAEEVRYAQAFVTMRKKNKHYNPIPKFKGGCKDC